MKIPKWKTGLCALLVLFSSQGVQAGPVFEIGAYFGGDELVRATFFSGDTQSIDAGGLIDLSVGGAFAMSELWQGRVTVGYRFDDSLRRSDD